MTLYVAITVDADNDDFSTSDQRNELSWRGLDLIPEIAGAVRDYNWRVTWFVRADTQIRKCYGSVAHLLDSLASTWRKLSDGGDEIGWHPHILNQDKNGLWHSERDDRCFVDALRECHEGLRARGHRFNAVRVGEAAGSNLILKTLVDLGLRVDSSAIPGRARDDASRRFDWGPTSNKPYRPSISDYRIAGNPCLPIVEVPMTTLPVRARHEAQSFLRYVNLAYHPSIFLESIEPWLESADFKHGDQVLTLILHPDELMPRDAAHSLYAFDLAALRSNLSALGGLAKARRVEIAGVTVSQVAQISMPAALK